MHGSNRVAVSTLDIEVGPTPTMSPHPSDKRPILGDHDHGSEQAIKKGIEHFYAETTFHALHYFGQSKTTIKKISWLHIFVAGIVIMVFSTETLLYNFLWAPSRVSVKVVTPSSGLTLPELTFCSMRRINRTKADKIGLNTTFAVDYLYGSFASMMGFYLSPHEIEYFEKNVNTSQVRHKYYAAFQKWKRIDNSGTQNLARMLKYLSQKCLNGKTFRCRIGGVEQENCCDKIGHFRNYNGPCFRFSFLRRIKQTVGGIREGLTALFEPPPDEIYVTSVFNVHMRRGLQMFFDPYSAGIERDPIFLAEGHDYSISLEARETDLLQTGGQSACSKKAYTEDGEGGNVTVTDPRAYCMYNCMSLKFIRTCGCKPINNLFIIDNPKPYCGPEQVVACFKRHRDKLRQDNSRACGDECYFACKQFHYSAKVSVTKLQTTPLHARSLPTLNPKAVRFSVYYPRIQYTSFLEYPTINIYQFIANVGGIMGLWTGASAVSVMHCFRFIIGRIMAHYGNYYCT